MKRQLNRQIEINAHWNIYISGKYLKILRQKRLLIINLACRTRGKNLNRLSTSRYAEASAQYLNAFVIKFFG